jgi:hypothetical protein
LIKRRGTLKGKCLGAIATPGINPPASFAYGRRETAMNTGAKTKEPKHQQVGGTLHRKAMKYHCYEIGMGHKDRI